MNESESLSMTPPLSPEGFELNDQVLSPPVLPRIEDEAKPACFHCLGEGSGRDGGFHGDGYLKSGFLQRLFSPYVNHDAGIGMEPFSLFSYTWPSDVVHNSNIEKLFLIVRQQISELQSAADRARLTFVIGDSMDGQDVRENVCQFLQYLMNSVHSGKLSEDSVNAMVTGLHTLLLHIGRLSDLPHHVLFFTPSISKMSTTQQCLHLHLDVYWRIMCLYHVLQMKYSAYLLNHRLCQTVDREVPLCDQMIHLAMWDLVAVAQLRIKASHGDPQKDCVFPCSCFKELWTLILKLSEWRSSNHIGESFWVSLHHVIKSVTEDDRELMIDMDDCRLLVNPPDRFDTEDPLGLCLTIMSHVAPLFKIPGGAEPDCVVVSNYHDLLTLLRKLLTTSSVTETVLRRHLKTCLQLTSAWEPNTSILITLWDFFYKRLNQNESFQSTSGTLDGFAYIDQSVATMYDRCKQWTQGHEGCLDNETSYQLFLRLLCLHLGKLYSTGSTQEWKQVKGRIYSKFHARRVQELMEGGLYNLTTLFITLGITADLEDVASKLCDFYDMLDIGSITFAKRSVIWRGAFTLMLVYVDRNMDITFLADRMVAAFESAVSDFSTAGIDTRHHLWKLILIYLEGLQEVVEASSTIQLSEHKLFCPGVRTLLSVCSEHELRTTLSTLHSVVQKFRQVKSETDRLAQTSAQVTLQHTEFGGALWRNVYSFITDHAQTLTPPPIVADMAASFCLLSINCPGYDSDGTCVAVFQTFASSDKINVSTSCRFLSHMLSSNDVMTRLKSDLDSYEKFIISAWFRCCLYLPAGTQILVEITRPVLTLSEVREVFKQSEVETIDDIDQVPLQFLKALEKAHRKIQSWQDKMAFQQQIIPYFADVLKHVGPVMKSLSPPEVVSNVYKMTGHLVKYCAKLIYVRQDVIIPGLISTMIVPHHILDPEKPVNPVFLNAVKDSLHLFIQGLSKLPYDRDPFVQRRLRDIVMVYLPKFALRSSFGSLMASSATLVHPIVASLSGSFIQSPSEESVKFRHYLLQLVTSNYLAVKNMTIHPSHTMGVSFIQEVIQRTTSTTVKAKDLTVLLSICLEYLLLLQDTSSTWTSVLNTLQDMSESYVSNMHTIESDVCDACGQFVTSYFKFSSTGVLRVMEKLAVLLPDVVAGSLDKLTYSVIEIETKRGVGMDQKLRGHYMQVLKLLGTRCSEEMTKLQS